MGARIVLDTNILVSALGWRGAPYEIVRSCFDRQHDLLLSPDLLEEVGRVLRYPKFRFSTAEILTYLTQLTETAEFVQPNFRITIIQTDPSDNRVLECALTGGAQVIVSGDNHLLSLKEFEAIPILRPREFLDRSGHS